MPLISTVKTVPRRAIRQRAIVSQHHNMSGLRVSAAVSLSDKTNKLGLQGGVNSEPPTFTAVHKYMTSLITDRFSKFVHWHTVYLR